MKKRLLSILLVLCMALTLFPAAAFAEGEATDTLSEASDETESSERLSEDVSSEPAGEDVSSETAGEDVSPEPAGGDVSSETPDDSARAAGVADPDSIGFLFLAKLDGYERHDSNAIAFANVIMLGLNGMQMQTFIRVDMANSQISGLEDEGPGTGGGTTYSQLNTWCEYVVDTAEDGDEIYTLTEVSDETSDGGVEVQFALDVTDTVYIDKNHVTLQKGNTLFYMDDNTVFANATLAGDWSDGVKLMTVSDVNFSYRGVGTYDLQVRDQSSVDSEGYAYPAAEIYALYDRGGNTVFAVVTIGGQRTEPEPEYTVTVTHNAGGTVRYGYMGWYDIASGGTFTLPLGMPSVGAIPYPGYEIGSIVVNGENLTSQMEYDANGGCQAVQFLVTADTTVVVTFVVSNDYNDYVDIDHNDYSTDDSGDDETGSDVAEPATSGGSTTVEISARTTTSGSTTKADIRASDMDKAVNSAVSEAIRQGTVPVVEIDVRTYSRTDSLEVSLPTSSLKTLADARGSSLVITSNVAEIELDHTALSALVNQATGSTITLEVAPVEPVSLNVAQREVVGTAPVIDLSLVSRRTAIHEYNNGVITVSLPYTLTFGQSASDVVVYYLESYGGLTPCSTRYADGKVTFTTTHLSKYVIGDKQLAEKLQKAEFTDVPATAYYADAVAWAVENDIAYGVTDTTFGPDAACTRAQIVSFLWRQAGSPKMSGTNPFTDVSESDYYYDAVLWAVENNIAYGTTDTTFSPNMVCTRAQAMSFLYRDKKSPAVSGTGSFTDVSASEYYAGAVQWAVANSVAYGITDTTFGPDQNCTRAQIISFMYRAN